MPKFKRATKAALRNVNQRGWAIRQVSADKKGGFLTHSPLLLSLTLLDRNLRVSKYVCRNWPLRARRLYLVPETPLQLNWAGVRLQPQQWPGLYSLTSQSFISQGEFILGCTLGDHEGFVFIPDQGHGLWLKASFQGGQQGAQ